VRTPLSWLREFAPFEGDPRALAAELDDLGLVVEGMEVVGEGLDAVVLARVEEIAPIDGADRIRRVVVDAGDGPVEVVCGAWNFAVGDIVPLAPVGAVLPGGFEIGRRKMRGVVSNGMLCSGRELALSDDHEGILVVTDPGAVPGAPLAETLGITRDVVFDIAVEADRPDAWSVAGVARDLAGRLGLPFALPDLELPTPSGPSVDDLASVVVDAPDLCPRITARVLTGVTIGPSPRLIARRLLLAGMRPINNVVDASNYVMLELGQPTHPYDLDRLPGHGLVVRQAAPGEVIVTLDGVERRLGLPGGGLVGEPRDCVICDADGSPVGIAGIMGGASSEITERTDRVLLETAYFAPMAIARTSKRLNLRTEASTRFERGCDPEGLERAAERFCALLGAVAPREGHMPFELAPGTIDVRGEVPTPFTLDVRPERVNELLGTALAPEAMAALLEPLGFAVVRTAERLEVTVPTARPDVRPAPLGVADIAEEVARMHGYSRLPRRQPSWPQPGCLTPRQRDRRLVRDVAAGLGASEVWTPSIVPDVDLERCGLPAPWVEVTNPLVAEERYLRGGLLPGLLGALRYNADRRQGELRLFELGTVFGGLRGRGAPGEERTGEGSGASAGQGRLVGGTGGPVEEREMLAIVFRHPGDDARVAVAAWWALVEALGIQGGAVRPPRRPLPALHPTRSARVAVSVPDAPSADGDAGPDAGKVVGATLVDLRGDPVVDGGFVVVGEVGEVDPATVAAYDAVRAGTPQDRVGYLAVDLTLLLDTSLVPRRSDQARPVSRFPSSDIDLAFVVADGIPVGDVSSTLHRAAGSLLEALDLFDVYRGPSLDPGTRSLAFHLRFCAPDRTLTDTEVGEVRERCIEAVRVSYGATLR